MAQKRGQFMRDVPFWGPIEELRAGSGPAKPLGLTKPKREKTDKRKNKKIGEIEKGRPKRSKRKGTNKLAETALKNKTSLVYRNHSWGLVPPSHK